MLSMKTTPGSGHRGVTTAGAAGIGAGHSGTGSHRPGGNSGPRPVGRLPHEPLGQRAGRQSTLAGVAPARGHDGRLGARLTSLAFYATRLARHSGLVPSLRVPGRIHLKIAIRTCFPKRSSGFALTTSP